jgi:hypothetical protein
MKSPQLNGKLVSYGVLLILLIVAWRWFLRRQAKGN